MKKYLVKLTIHIGEFEKTSVHVVIAKNKQKAQEKAMESECHIKPDYSEFPDKSACWDAGEFLYEPYLVVELTNEEFEVFNKFNI